MSVGAYCLGILMLVSTAAGQLPIAAVRVEGNRRLPGDAIARATGVRPGQKPVRAELDAAANALFNTGLFTSVNYRYDPVAGTDPQSFTITFQVVEDPADTDVRIEIAGIDEAAIWKELAVSEPLVTPRMPHNDRAGEFYCRALERLLERANRHEKIAATSSVDLASRRMETTLAAANPPRVNDVRFSGSRALSAQALREASPDWSSETAIRSASSGRFSIST
jgi:outer membrane protein assembly factor BamA